MMELKTCPFCGAEAEEILGSSCWKIRCTVCKAEITGIDRRTNINNWNRRIEPPKKVVAQIKVDIDELEHIHIPTQAQREYAIEIFDKIPTVTSTASEDCISRQKAIETCDRMYPKVDRQDIKAVIEATPSVTPTERTTETMIVDGMEMEIDPLSYGVGYTHGQTERPKGEWIFNPKDAIDSMFTKPKCSNCGFESADGGNFCPNCGADMRGEKDEK